jgi:hypothetical protein
MESNFSPRQAGLTDGRKQPPGQDARTLLLDKGADQLKARPWQNYPGGSPTAADLTQYALWRSSELTQDELLGALSLLPTARAEAETVEIGLLFAARADGLTWAQIAEAMGFRSPQACQQYVSRLSAKQDSRP